MGSEPGAASSADDARLLDWLATRDAGDAVADAATRWATDALTRACPIVTGLLAIDGRLPNEVAAQLRQGDRPASISEWGLEFATRLESDADPWIAWAAQVDASTLVVERARRKAKSACPG